MLRHLDVPAWKVPLIARHMRRLVARDAGELSLFPGIPGLLADLRAGGVSLALVSSNREDVVRRVLGPDSAGLIGRYACGAALFGKARRFRAVLRDSGVSPADVLCLGDELRDHHAARQAGLAFGAVTWGYTRAEALASAGPAHLFALPRRWRRRSCRGGVTFPDVMSGRSLRGRLRRTKKRPCSNPRSKIAPSRARDETSGSDIRMFHRLDIGVVAARK